MKTIKIGLFGVGRGLYLSRYCKQENNVELVAVCDKWEEGLTRAKNDINDEKVIYYNDFDEFIKHDMDVVFLANYATEHAPFAIKAMLAGKDVISEVLPVQTMAQAVALINCVEKTGRNYYYAENYCFMPGPREMKRLYLKGKLGEFEYGEGEYLHNCEDVWESITKGDPKHWRNIMSAFFYCTHSAGPLLHITGQRAVKVVGVEGLYNRRMARMGAKAGNMAIEIATLENGATIKSIHGVGPSKNSIWFSVYGSKGRTEIAREDTKCGEIFYSNLDEIEGINSNKTESYYPEDELSKKGESFGHGGSDYICLWNIFNHMNGDSSADIIDVYEATDMWMIGFFGQLSAMNNSNAEIIPDLRDKNIRIKYENDNRCTDASVAGDQLLPSYVQGIIE